MAAAAPAVNVNSGNNLTDIIERNRESVRTRRYETIGKMLNIMLGPDDSAEYMRGGDAHARVSRLSKVQGIQIDWGQDRGPVLAWAPGRSNCTFPFGIDAPPRIKNPLNHIEKTNNTISQNLEDYASGFIAGRDGSKFLVLQPVLYIGVWPFGVPSLFTVLGHPDQFGKYPALLINTKKREGHIVGGILELTTSRAGSSSVPWNRR